MRFNSDGKFKIMQITDIQEIPDVSPDTIKLINAALEEAKPDLVVLTGDQIKGYGVSYKGKGDALIESVAGKEGEVLDCLLFFSGESAIIALQYSSGPQAPGHAG